VGRETLDAEEVVRRDDTDGEDDAKEFEDILRNEDAEVRSLGSSTTSPYGYAVFTLSTHLSTMSRAWG
jgi:hypothetical protein